MTLVVDAKQIRVTSKKKCYEVMGNECYSVCMIMVTVELLHCFQAATYMTGQQPKM